MIRAPLYLLNETMANFHELVAAAKRSDDEYKERLEKQRQSDGRIPFGASPPVNIGQYEPSDAVKRQLERLAEIQQNTNRAVLECEVQF